MLYVSSLMMTCVLCPDITEHNKPYGGSGRQCINLLYMQFCHYVPIISFLPSSVHPVKHFFANYNVPPPLSAFLSCISAPRAPSSSDSPWSHRSWELAPPAGQRHAGCQRPVSANGGDREAGCAESPPGGEGALLYFY